MASFKTDFPEEISIGGKTFTVKEVPIVDENPATAYYGQIRYSTNEIVIKEGMSHDMKVETLLHEIIHGINFSFGDCMGNNEEQIAQTVAAGIHQALKPYLTFGEG